MLSQLGNRVQHALRAFTPDDADALRKTARTFPVTEHYDVERTITSLGIGEALVTVLSPKGVPTPWRRPASCRRTRGWRRSAEPRSPQVVAASALATRYGETVDRESAHEIITARLSNARAAAATAAAEATMRDQVSPTTNAGLGTMTPAQQKREIERQARELRKAQEAAERERKAQAREAAAAARQREKTIETGIRTAGKVVSSRAGQSLLRGVFDTIFGSGKRR